MQIRLTNLPQIKSCACDFFLFLKLHVISEWTYTNKLKQTNENAAPISLDVIDQFEWRSGESECGTKKYTCIKNHLYLLTCGNSSFFVYNAASFDLSFVGFHKPHMRHTVCFVLSLQPTNENRYLFILYLFIHWIYPITLPFPTWQLAKCIGSCCRGNSTEMQRIEKKITNKNVILKHIPLDIQMHFRFRLGVQCILSVFWLVCMCGVRTIEPNHQHKYYLV